MKSKKLALAVAGLIAVSLAMFGGSKILMKGVTAQTNTELEILNTEPSFTVDPAESTASHSGSPTNAGSSITFNATADDPNGEDYYLIICKTNSVTPTNGGAPTCVGGSWCVSSATGDTSQASCSYSTVSGDAESNAWYGFVCDGNASSAACSTSSQGSGNSGTPFSVNHRPLFTAAPNDGPKTPGSLVTWTSQSTSDADTDGSADNVTLIVCKTQGISGADCDGGASDRWCVSTASAFNPSCSYTLPSVDPVQTRAAYVYVVDSHNFAASGGAQDTNSSFTTSNVSPTVSLPTLNSGNDISLTAGTTTNVTVTGTVTDTNSCEDLSGGLASVVSNLYIDQTGLGGQTPSCPGSADDNNCYVNAACTISANTCDSSTDSSASYTCTVAVQYFADATDSGGNNLPYVNPALAGFGWYGTIVATDEAGVSSYGVSSIKDVLALSALSIGESSINYGNVAAGFTSTTLDTTTTVYSKGNVGIDVTLYGTDMTDGNYTIPLANQKYALAASTSYASGTALISSPGVRVDLNVFKTTSTTAASKQLWWGISIPLGIRAGSYTGQNTFVANPNDPSEWQ